MYCLDTCISFTYALRGFLYQHNICISRVHELAYIYYVGTSISLNTSLHVSTLHTHYFGTCISLSSWLPLSALHMYYVGTCISLVRRGYIYQPYKCTSWVHLSALHCKCTSLVHLSALRTTWLHASAFLRGYL